MRSWGLSVTFASASIQARRTMLGVFHPASPRPVSPTVLSTPELNTVIIRVAQDPSWNSSTLRSIAAVVDPGLRFPTFKHSTRFVATC